MFFRINKKSCGFNIMGGSFGVFVFSNLLIINQLEKLYKKSTKSTDFYHGFADIIKSNDYSSKSFEEAINNQCGECMLKSQHFDFNKR